MSNILIKELTYGEQALKVAQEVKDKVTEANAFNDLGNLYSARINKSQPASFGGTKDNPVLELSAEGIQNFFGDATRAIDYLEKAADAFQKLGNFEMTGSSLFMLAFTLSETGHKDRALAVAHDAARILAKINSSLLNDVNEFLAVIEQ